MQTTHARLRALVLAAACILLISGAALFPGCSSQPSGPELWILGLDGADWDVIDPLIAAGKMPNLAKLRREGSWGRLRSDQPMLSPILWTSMATGRTADEHGVTWFMTTGPDGAKIPISSRNRKTRALWNITSEQGLRTGILGWWATWPVEPIDGWIVSDYVGWHSFGVTGSEFEAPGKVWPAKMQAEVTAMIPSPDDVDDALLQKMVHLPAEKLGFDASRGPFGGPLPHLRQAVATARGYTDIALHLLKKDRPQLFSLYYEGCDAILHLFSSYAAPQQDWVSDEDYAAFKDAVDEYWSWQDELLGEVLAQRGENTTVMIISDHGFRTGNERLREERFEIELADASHMPDGIVLLHGPGIRARHKIEGADIYDVTPTALHLMGLAVAEDMAGTPMLSAQTPEARAANPVQKIPTYEKGNWDRGDDLVVDEAAGERMEEMLRSLGYISGGEGGEDDSSATDQIDVENAVNMATILMNQGRFAEAIKALEEQRALSPSHFEVRLNLAQAYARAGRTDDAKTLYQQLRDEQPDNLSVIEDLARVYALQEDFASVSTIYGEALQSHPDWAPGLAGRGFALHRNGDTSGGAAMVERARSLDPRLADAHFYSGVISKESGRVAESRTALERAVALDPGHEQANLQLSDTLAKLGDYAGARRVLERAVEATGDTPILSAQLGVIDLQSGNVQEALPRLRAAARSLPDDPLLLGNLGVAFAMAGEMGPAIAAFEKVIAMQPSNAEAHGQLGNFYVQARRLDDADRELKKARELDPTNPAFPFALASILHERGQLPAAIKGYEEVLKLDPQNAYAIYQMAMAYGASGNEEKAYELIDQARAIDPSIPAPQRQ